MKEYDWLNEEKNNRAARILVPTRAMRKKRKGKVTGRIQVFTATRALGVNSFSPLRQSRL